MHRLAAVRRFYVYLVAFVSQIFVLVGVIDPIRSDRPDVARAAVSCKAPSRASATARSIGMLAVATPLFLVHWWLGQRFREEPPSVLLCCASSFRTGRPQSAWGWCSPISIQSSET
jgi:hypothetical protein